MMVIDYDEAGGTASGPHSVPVQAPATVVSLHAARVEAHADLMRRALRICDRECVAAVESEGVSELRDGVRWYDIRQMLSHDEHCAEFVDMHREMLDYALDRRLVIRHALLPHLVRVAVLG